MILYLHGFKSSGNSSKVEIIKEHFPNEIVISPTLTTNIEDELEKLVEIVNSSDTPVTVYGSSLGGFYALALNNRVELKNVILLNPSLKPWESLSKQTGSHYRYGSIETFELTVDHLLSFQKIGEEINSNDLKSNIIAVLTLGDEVLDVKQSLRYFAFTKTLVFEGDHRIQDGDFKNILKVIDFEHNEIL